jgi:hypothetical protein
MKIPFYLTVSQRGSVRATKTPASLDWDEIAIKIELNLPDQLFKRPFLQASIDIPASIIPESPLNAEIANNVKEVIKQSTNLEFNVRVISDEENE